MVTMTKFHDVWRKIVDFLVANFELFHFIVVILYGKHRTKANH